MYRQLISHLLIVIFFVNNFGWLGFGLMINQSQIEDAKVYCEVVLCSCEVSDGTMICSCCHPAFQTESDLYHPEETNQFCFLKSSNSDESGMTQILIPINKYEALFLSAQRSNDFLYTEEYNLFKSTQKFSGYLADLLRPPQIVV
jgi:hypothetical protein